MKKSDDAHRASAAMGIIHTSEEATPRVYPMSGSGGGTGASRGIWTWSLTGGVGQQLMRSTLIGGVSGDEKVAVRRTEVLAAEASWRSCFAGARLGPEPNLFSNPVIARIVSLRI